MPAYQPLRVARPVLAAVRAHVAADAPLECCGFLAGRFAGAGAEATRAYPLVNALASPLAFLTDPRSVFDAFRAMRAAGEELLAIYHSHPTSAPVPSRRDLAENSYGPAIPWLIVGRTGADWEAAVWTLDADAARPARWEVTDCPDIGLVSVAARPNEPIPAPGEP